MSRLCEYWPQTLVICVHIITIVGFTLTVDVVNNFRQFLSPFSNNFHEILQNFCRILQKFWRIVCVKFHENWLRIDWEVREIHSFWSMNLMWIWLWSTFVRFLLIWLCSSRSHMRFPDPSREYVQFQFITCNSSTDKATCVNFHQIVLWCHIVTHALANVESTPALLWRGY